MDDKTALAFNTICNFIRDLNASFGSKQKSLMLYGHLIEKTGLIHIYGPIFQNALNATDV